MKENLQDTLQRMNLTLMTPKELDACVVGLIKTEQGKPAVVYDFRFCMKVLMGLGKKELRSREILYQQAEQLGVVLLDSTLAAPDPKGSVTITTNEEGECVAVTRTDEDHRILSVIWARGTDQERAETKKRHADMHKKMDENLGRLPLSGAVGLSDQGDHPSDPDTARKGSL